MIEFLQFEKHYHFLNNKLLFFFVGAIIPMDAAWAAADITMRGMTLINLPVCMLMGRKAIDCLKDYEAQKNLKKDPVFEAKSIDINMDELDCWKWIL